MNDKKIFLQDIKENENLKTSLMIMKRLYKDGDKYLCILSDKSGQIKAKLPTNKKIETGLVINIDCKKNKILDVSNFKTVLNYNIQDYLPTSSKPIEDIMNEIETISQQCITSEEGQKLNDYFFKDDEFLKKFKQSIGGIAMHHNYIGGLAEHTLNVMYLTKVFCERYDCRRIEIAVLSAKLHDIGKIYELDYSGPFKYTLQGELEGHIVIGIQLIDRALNNINYSFSEDFVRRIKGCIVQHHGKVEYGSPKATNMEESFILNYADTVDAVMNKITKLKKNTDYNNWSDYDKAIDTKLYL
ncbi:HD domain-containing protein [Romboutsia sedimentorum]|uniref:HD domain-containing protein n=1 Tax=Romboutsia sedimentorum TaxID=1368474 RepID=A0ABT7E5M0_9FIRM|nr:HD domain-containing protein [Romboutsia sedimentorum]MDK2561967.1 HD domain-containing protein [Romboutsia sedimentorum]MDK2586761.1 HD domain-containing protein [Romboutsia sedimentorum]